MSFTGDTGGGGTAFGPLTWNTSSAAAALGTKYLLPYETEPGSTECFQIVSGPGTYTTIKVVASAAFATDSFTYTVRLNGVDTGLTVTLAAGATSAVGTGSVAVVAGDRISVKVVQSGSEVNTARSGIGVY